MGDRLVLNNLQCVVAPMVSQSDAPFRTLCLKHGATVAYTEMLYSDKVVTEEGYLEAYLPSLDHNFFDDQYVSRPLVVQMCGNDPSTMAKAAELIVTSQDGVDAIDINLGCPQDRARDGLFGSFLLDKQHWDRVFSCVKACSNVLALHDTPLFCKIRLIEGADTIELTTTFCRGLIKNGCKVICIHGRTRGSTKKRRCGPADLVAIAVIAQTIQAEYNGAIQVISNGNITTPADVHQALRDSHPSCGVMSAEGILANPALFLGVAAGLKSTDSTGFDSAINASALPSNNATTGKRTHTTANEATATEVVTNTDNAHAAATISQCPASASLSQSPSPPSLLALFQEYCALSEQYRIAGGWAKLDAHFARPAANNTTTSTSASSNAAADSVLCDSAGVPSASIEHSEISHRESTPSEAINSDNCACVDAPLKVAYTREPRQMYIARQHLSWMLGKSGHGRMVRYQWIGAYYKKHVHLMQDMNSATSIADLLSIAERCLPC